MLGPVMFFQYPVVREAVHPLVDVYQSYQTYPCVSWVVRRLQSVLEFVSRNHQYPNIPPSDVHRLPWLGHENQILLVTSLRSNKSPYSFPPSQMVSIRPNQPNRGLVRKSFVVYWYGSPPIWFSVVYRHRLHRLRLPLSLKIQK